MAAAMSRSVDVALVGLAVREWLGLGREEPEPEITEPKYPDRKVRVWSA
jgi:hypothetical protein